MKENKATTTQVEETNIENTNNSNKIPKEIRIPIFILFAEYLGYVSPLVEWAEEWCKKETSKFPNFKKKILATEAKHIFDKMVSELELKEIRQWYDDLYELTDKDCEDNLKAKNDDLPF